MGCLSLWYYLILFYLFHNAATLVVIDDHVRGGPLETLLFPLVGLAATVTFVYYGIVMGIGCAMPFHQLQTIAVCLIIVAECMWIAWVPGVRPSFNAIRMRIIIAGIIMAVVAQLMYMSFSWDMTIAVR